MASPGSWRSGSRASSARSRPPDGRCRGCCSRSTRSPVFLLVYVLDLYEREPLSLVVAALRLGRGRRHDAVRRSRNDGWGLVVARVGGPEFAARWTAALTAPFVEETLKGCRRRADLPDRARRVRRRDGRVRLRRASAAWDSPSSRTSSTSWASSAASRPACCRGSSSGSWRAASTRTSCTRGSSGWASAYVVSRRSPRPLGRRLLVLVGLSCARGRSATSCGTPRCSTSSRPSRGPAPIWLMVPVATTVKGLPLLVFVTLAVCPRAPARTAVAARLPSPARSAWTGISAEELDDARGARRRRRAAVRDDAPRARGSGGRSLLARLQREQVNLAMVRRGCADGRRPGPDRAARVLPFAPRRPRRDPRRRGPRR